MIRHLQTAYVTYRRVRIATSLLLLVYVIVLYMLGGFPPWAWQLLFRILPMLPKLWAVQGVALVFPLGALVLFSLSLLILWGLSLVVVLKMVLHWWSRIRSSAVHMRMPALFSAEPSRKECYRGSGNSHVFAPPSPVVSMQSAVYAQHSRLPYPVGKSGDAPAVDDYPTMWFPSLCAAHSPETLPARQDHNVHLLIGIGSDPGLVRKRAPNEDSVLAVQETRTTKRGSFPVGLFVVADGMGGHADGKLASQLVIQSIRDIILPALRSEADEMVCAELLHSGVQQANFTLYQRNLERHAMMGTTMTGAIIFGTRAHIVSVGDSRTYLYRPFQGLKQITRDHSLVAELVAAKLITPDEVYTHPRRNEITRCLGDKEEVEIDSFIVPLEVGDILLLCSDGLWEMVRNPDIEELITSSPRQAEQLTELLIQAALNRGGADNVSVVVVCVAEAA
jgi:serine/threonine protein phosphatase PrpC